MVAPLIWRVTWGAALANAVTNALVFLGVQVTELPLTPKRISAWLCQVERGACYYQLLSALCPSLPLRRRQRRFGLGLPGGHVHGTVQRSGSRHGKTGLSTPRSWRQK